MGQNNALSKDFIAVCIEDLKVTVGFDLTERYSSCLGAGLRESVRANEKNTDLVTRRDAEGALYIDGKLRIRDFYMGLSADKKIVTRVSLTLCVCPDTILALDTALALTLSLF